MNIKYLTALLLSVSGVAQADTLLSEALSPDIMATTVKATSTLPTSYTWMNSDVSVAWKSGYTGSGTNMIIVDDFSSGNKFSGKLTDAIQTKRHGEWTSQQASLLAPNASITNLDFYNSKSTLSLKSGLNLINASYGLMAKAGYNPTLVIGTTGLQSQIVNAAKNGTAIVVKAAGNNGGVSVNGTTNGAVDYLNLALIGAKTAIYVGALDKHGSTTSKASIASYSNIAGSNTTIQKQFLVVGVPGSKTGLYGTSFAAPTIEGYGSILGSKFKTATATQITNQLLNTARTDTIANYSASVHGRGEASLSRALAPTKLQ